MIIKDSIYLSNIKKSPLVKNCYFTSIQNFQKYFMSRNITIKNKEDLNLLKNQVVSSKENTKKSNISSLEINK